MVDLIWIVDFLIQVCQVFGLVLVVVAVVDATARDAVVALLEAPTQVQATGCPC